MISRKSQSRELTQYEGFVESLPVMAWLADTDGQFLYFNCKWRNFTGLTGHPEHLDVVETVIYPDDQKWFTEAWRRALARSEAVQVEHRMRGVDGNYRWHLAQAAPVHGGDGLIRFWIWILTDIDELKRSKEALQILSQTGVVLSESLDYETILKAVAILVLESMADLCLIDLFVEGRERKIERVISMHRDLKLDRLATKLKDFPPIVREGDLVFDSLKLDATRLIESVDDTHLSRVARCQEHLELLHQLDPRSAIVLPLRSHESTFGALSLLRSGARPAFTAAELPLAEEVARRAALAIENARLFQRAQKANQAKTEFLANVSHEIRTPLGAILGFTEILQTDDVNDEERGRYLSIIRRNGQQLSELIGDLLDLSKIESGKLDLDVSRFSLKQVISDLMSTFSFKAREKGVAIETSFDPDLPDMIATDQLRLKQIIINIIGNAVKFSSRGKISIHVRSNPRHGQNLIAIDVRDEGIGIAPEAREKLFHAFTQADSTMSRRFGGTGLGLLLARRLAHALEGNVELVWSEVGKGSTFEITFKPDLFNDQVPLAVSTQPTAVAAPTPTPTPVAAPAPVPVPVPIPAPPKETSAPAYAGRVLVVEDSPDNQVLVGRMLKKKGVTVEFADNGAEGVHKGSSQLFDLILMDIQMPVLDGYSAISQLREKGIQTPIVALTAHAMHEDRQHCMSVGCNDYVTKPIDAHRLTEIVARYLRQPGRPGATGGES